MAHCCGLAMYSPIRRMFLHLKHEPPQKNFNGKDTNASSTQQKALETHGYKQSLFLC
jgi:hypothetical protein